MATGESQRARFDPVINIGHILIVLGIVASAIGVYVAGEIRVNILEVRVKALEGGADRYIASNDKLADALTEIRIELAALKARLPQPQSSLAPALR
jgi:hypothetical protein